MKYLKKFEFNYWEVEKNGLTDDVVSDIQDLFLGVKEKHDIIELDNNEDIDDVFTLINVLGKPNIYYKIKLVKKIFKKPMLPNQ